MNEVGRCFSSGLQLLRDSLDSHNASFREHQWESIKTLVVDRERLLAVQKTGWGKSSVYFIATRLLRDMNYGPTIIISPLLALIRDQILAANKFKVRLGTINSSNGSESKVVEQQFLAGQLDALIISPERLANDQFLKNVLLPAAGSAGLLVIDEAHCISDWGHDFRPDYKRIKNILPFMPRNIPVLATTATANSRVVDDIADQLGENISVLRGDLTRQSLHLQCINLPKRSQRLAWLADTIPQLDGTGIIYASTVHDANQVAEWLRRQGIQTGTYTSRMNNLSRLQAENALRNNQIKVLVATTALGMGYDKPDLAFVIHYQSPGSVVHYYQQVGRAGRAIPQAWGVLLSGDEDEKIQHHFINHAFPSQELVDEVLECLTHADTGLTKADIERRVNAKSKKIEGALKYLLVESPAPIIEQDKRFYRTNQEYQLPTDLIHGLSQRKKTELNELSSYLEHEGCLMQYLAEALDDELAKPCGKCANCEPELALSEVYTHEAGIKAVDFLKRSSIDISPKRRVATRLQDAWLRFPVYRFDRNFGTLAHEPGRALCRWGDAGWGEIAKNGKQQQYLDDKLVEASGRLIMEEWRPSPQPQWITYVPSHHCPQLVAGFAYRLADHLGIPCIEAVSKVRANEPQKRMENSEFRCLNLDGAFQVTTDLSRGPVLLIDDAVDSGWTFAVIGALLRRAGSGPVYPFALMSTASSS